MQSSYGDALASTVTGDIDAGEKWELWGRQYAAALALSQLLASEKIVRRLRVPDPPEVFGDQQIIAEGIGVGQFTDMLLALMSRTPFLAEDARRMARELPNVAAAAASVEPRRAMDMLSESRAVRALFVSGVDLDTTTRIKEAIADVIRSGPTKKPIGLPEFIDRAQLEGAANLSRSRLETVLRTNMTTAAVDGQRATYRKPEVQRIAPLVMLLEIDDSRSRPTHQAMHGYVNTSEEFDRYGIWPPAGYNCRGSTRSVSLAEGARLGLIDRDTRAVLPDRVRAFNGARQDMIDRGIYPDAGFRKAG